MRPDIKRKRRIRRKAAIRKRIFGNPEAPRLSVFKSNKHIYAQVIDDVTGTTIASASSLDKDVKSSVNNCGNIESAKLVGKLIAERAQAKEVKEVVFDRGGYLYHGRVQALAEAAREAGLSF